LYREYKVSVVTVVLNGASTLLRAIESVADQDYPLVEHIIVDGGSTDGTLDIVVAAGDRIDRLIEGPDSGIAEAMNKGLAAATGDLILFLHADDRFESSHSLALAMTKVTDLEHIWAFDILFGTGIRQSRSVPRPFNWWTWFKNPLPHQGVLCPRSVFDRIGGFDESLRIDMDYDLWLRAYLAGISLRRVNKVLAVMADSGISSRRDWPGLRARFAEERTVQHRHARTRIWRWAYALYWPLYLGYRRVRCGLRGSP
jgi:glycosyltransferase involved in cell wall biosynthesis